MEDYEILTLFEKYNIGQPEFENSREEIEKIKEKCFKDYKYNIYKRAFNLRLACVDTNFFINEQILKKANEINFISDRVEEIFELMKEKKGRCWVFRTFKKNMLEYFSGLSEIEKKYTSLDLGKETNFINDILQEKIEYITYDTFLRIINLLGFNNTEFHYICNLENKRYLELRKEKHKFNYNVEEVQRDIFKFRKMWGK